MKARDLVRENAVIASSGQIMVSLEVAEELLIRFAKLHVKAALEAASNSAESDMAGAGVNKESILNAYPEENIK